MAEQIKVVRTDAELQCPGIDKGLRDYGARLVLLPDGISEERLAREVRDAHLLLMCYTPVTERVLREAKKLKGIVKYGVGIDAIDIVTARELRIPVVNVPEYAEETVAEGAFALMIALAKRHKAIAREMDLNGWAWPASPLLGSDLAGKTMGLVGVGKIGRSMARMGGAGFRMRVLGYDPLLYAETLRSLGVEKVDSLNDMLAQSDFVSIHTVLSPQTRHLIGAEQFAAMKRTAYFVNVSRGAIVDELALLAALKNGLIAGAGLDVYGIEPVAKSGHPLSDLYAMNNVILSPHLTFFTHEAMQRLEDDTLARCYEMLEGRPVLIRSRDPRLTAQEHGVTFA